MAFSTHDIVSDTPTNNFATLNVLLPTTTVTVSNGNLSGVVGNAATKIFSTFLLPNTGQWYWEVVFSTLTAEGSVGIAEVDCDLSTHVGNDINSFGFRSGNKATNSVNTSYGSTYGTGDVVRVLWDGDNRQILFGVNGTMYGVAFTVSTDKDYYPAFGDNAAGLSSTFSVNFGQDPTFAGNKNTPATVNINGTNVTGPFAPSGTAAGTAGLFYYPPPADALALCTANLPDFTPTVTGDVPQDYFKAVLYTGNGGTQSITGVGFQPDLVWIKDRTSTINYNHQLYDSIRGINSGLIVNQNYAVDDYSAFSSFDSNGFTVPNALGTNTLSENMVAWCWKAGGSPSGSTSTTGSAKRINTSGTQDDTSCSALATAATNAGASNVITPTLMSINQAAGFSIVKYTGTGSAATIPHGLSSAPEMVICKTLDFSSGTNWVIYFKGATTTSQYLLLNSSNQVGTLTNYWGTAEPTNNVFSVAAAEYDNNRSNNIIAYCWHSVEGYSKFGSYTGNGSADGPFVYCGFRPAFVICKCSSDTTTTHTSWAMYDNARDSSNVMNKVLYANEAINEGYRGDGSTAATDIYIDFLSNGFKVRSTKEEVNDTDETYIFMAFAEQPFKFSNAR
jgi:hypothetical protein